MVLRAVVALYDQRGGGIETTPLPSRPAGTGRCTFLSVNHGIHRQVVAQEATNAAASEEVLFVDPRGTLTPAQAVDQRLFRLLARPTRGPRAGRRRA